jgi:CDGSH-type Zn-finger protein
MASADAPGGSRGDEDHAAGQRPVHGRGELELVSPSGEPIAVRGSKAFLCRCGGSTLKPFSDGTHSRIGFQAAEAAVARQDAEA